VKRVECNAAGGEKVFMDMPFGRLLKEVWMQGARGPEE
jgi:hypothetical protein